MQSGSSWRKETGWGHTIQIHTCTYIHICIHAIRLKLGSHHPNTYMHIHTYMHTYIQSGSSWRKEAGWSLHVKFIIILQPENTVLLTAYILKKNNIIAAYCLHFKNKKLIQTLLTAYAQAPRKAVFGVRCLLDTCIHTYMLCMCVYVCMLHVCVCV